jgi:hypothetical protein
MARAIDLIHQDSDPLLDLQRLVLVLGSQYVRQRMASLIFLAPLGREEIWKPVPFSRQFSLPGLGCPILLMSAVELRKEDETFCVSEINVP